MPRLSCLWQDILYCNSKYWLRTSKLNIQMHLIVVSSRICIYHVLQLLNYPVVLCESTVNRLYYCYLNININVYFLWNYKLYEYRIYICIQICRKCNNVWLWLIFWLVAFLWHLILSLCFINMYSTRPSKEKYFWLKKKLCFEALI